MADNEAPARAGPLDPTVHQERKSSRIETLRADDLQFDASFPLETAMRALPEAQRQQSVLALLGPYQRPLTAVAKSLLSTERYRAALAAAGFDIPRLSAELIGKYVADLRHVHGR